MGIDVSAGGAVSLAEEHEHRVQTRADRRPSLCRVDGVEVRCVLRRTKAGDDRNDGNPLIYALKRLHGYTMDPAEVRKLHRRAVLIGRRAVLPGQFDVVVPAPSSSPTVARIARAIRLRVGGAAIIADVFRKATVREALAAAPDPLHVPVRDRDAYKSALGRLRKAQAAKLFSMKDIDVRARPYFQPIMLDPDARLRHGQRIVIVDDLLASGRTIACGAELLQRYFRPADISGLVLLSPLRP